jgi:hypothetical protein
MENLTTDYIRSIIQDQGIDVVRAVFNDPVNVARGTFPQLHF